MKIAAIYLICVALCLYSCSRNPGGTNIKASLHDLNKYRVELDSLRKKTSKPIKLPSVRFFQFGMGNRTKLLYKNGILINAITGDTVRKWTIKTDIIVPYSYMVHLITTDNKKITIKEDSNAVWIYSKWKDEVVPGTNTRISLPEFGDLKYPRIMKVLHHEILINIVNGKPLPNFYVYNKPKRRDAAMMAMCLNYTGNLSLIKNWVINLNEPYDRYNGGEPEADNLGQSLYLISLFSNKNHTLVSKILDEAKKIEVQESFYKYISGLTNSHPAPVYQNKWLKFGLKKLGIDNDEYSIPFIEDDYSALVWWDFRSFYKPGMRDADKINFPYLGWARDHYHGHFSSPVSNYDYPLTWEKEAPSANYTGMNKIDAAFAIQKIAVPHSWHAAEMFLYLLEKKKTKYQMTNKFL